MPFERGVTGSESRSVSLGPRPSPGNPDRGQTYIPHPVEIPVRFRVRGVSDPSCRRLENPGLGGIRFHCQKPYRPGLELDLDVRVCGEWRSLRGLVVSLAELPQGYELGVGFQSSTDAFEGRMLEQACHIESYKLGIRRTQGRDISADQAALEWIGLFSASFPAL